MIVVIDETVTVIAMAVEIVIATESGVIGVEIGARGIRTQMVMR